MNSGSPTMGHHANWWEDPFAPQDDPTECSWEEMNNTIRSYRRVALEEPEDIFAQVRREDGKSARGCLLWCVSAAVVRLRRLPGLLSWQLWRMLLGVEPAVESLRWNTLCVSDVCVRV